MPADLQIATPENFDHLLTAEPGLTVVYFWGHDCPNCEIFARDFPDLLNELPSSGIRFLKVNAYDHTDLARRYGLAGIPAFVLFKDGKKLGMMRQYYGREYWKSVITEQAGASV